MLKAEYKTFNEPRAVGSNTYINESTPSNHRKGLVIVVSHIIIVACMLIGLALNIYDRIKKACDHASI